MEVNNNLSAAALDPTARMAATRANAPERVGSASFQKLIDQASAGDVWSEVDAASKVVTDLHARGREIHFDVNDDSGKLSIEVRDLEGRVVRSVPSGDVVDIAAGKIAA